MNYYQQKHTFVKVLFIEFTTHTVFSFVEPYLKFHGTINIAKKKQKKQSTLN